MSARIWPGAPRLSADRFARDGATFSQEISTLGRPLWGRLYDDACDEGFVLVSPRTGSEVAFYLDRVDESGGDVAGWWFKPVDKSLPWRVLIVND